jgi:hypothetical protein
MTRVRNWLRWHWATVPLLLAPAHAQARIGLPAPALPVALPGGAEPALQGEQTPRATVIAFHVSTAAAAIDGDALRALQARHGREHVGVVVVVPEAGAELPEGLRDLPVGVDQGSAVRAGWLGDEPDVTASVFVVARGDIVWAGRPEHGLPAAVAAAVEGSSDPRQAAELLARRQFLVDGFDDAEGAAAVRDAQWILDRCPTDGVAWGLRYLAESEKLVDGKAAAATAAAAGAALAGDPRALGTFADLALRGDRRNRTLPGLVAEPLAAAAKAFPNDLRVQLAWLRALVYGGRSRDVGRAAHLLAKKVRDHAPAALEFVDILTQDEPAAVHRDLCEQALQRAERPGADARLLTAARYAIARRCAGDLAAAKAIADPYMDAHGARVVLNNDAWYFMTELPTRGRFDVFALALVERMLEQKDAMEYFEFDTAALAMYLAGRVDAAIELQQAAIDKGGKDNEAYVQRLERYQAAK